MPRRIGACASEIRVPLIIAISDSLFVSAAMNTRPDKYRNMQKA
jgi:hypothetical protein